MRKFIVAALTALALSTGAPAFAEGTEKMEEVLIEKWHFFRDGDLDKDGFISRTEFFAHPVYAAVGWKDAPKTFIWWMVDDNKDQKISLQEWFNNELGQFQLGDVNHDGFINPAEYEAMIVIQEKLFTDMNFEQ